MKNKKETAPTTEKERENFWLEIEMCIRDRPRMKVRTGAALETPHIMMLADDPGCTLIEPVAAHKACLLYTSQAGVWR